MTVQHYLISQISVCCMSQALQSNCQGCYQLWDIFTEQQFEANKYCEIKCQRIKVYSQNKLSSIF